MVVKSKRLQWVGMLGHAVWQITVIMEVAGFSAMLVHICQTTWCHISENNICYLYRWSLPLPWMFTVGNCPRTISVCVCVSYKLVCIVDSMQWQSSWSYQCWRNPCSGEHEWLHKGCQKWNLCSKTCTSTSHVARISWYKWSQLHGLPYHWCGYFSTWASKPV